MVYALFLNTVRKKKEFCLQEELLEVGKLLNRVVLIALKPLLQRVLHREMCHEQLFWHWPGCEDIPGLQQQAR